MHMHAHIRRQVESRTNTNTQQTYARLYTHHPHLCVRFAPAPYSAAFWLYLFTLNYTQTYARTHPPSLAHNTDDTTIGFGTAQGVYSFAFRSRSRSFSP